MVSRMMRIIPSPLRKMITHVGRRGLFLLFWAFLWINTGTRWSVRAPLTEDYAFINSVIPPKILGYVLMATGVGMALGAFIKRLDPLSYAISTWLVSALAVGVLWTWPSTIAGWTIVATYVFYMILVLVVSDWPEVPPSKDQKNTGT